MNIKHLAGTATAVLALLATAPAQAEWPDKPIRIVVPYSAGGGTDIVARNLAEKMRPFVHDQTIIVDNRPGANGIIGTDFVVRSPPDGTTIVLVVMTHLLNPVVTLKMPYDTFKDLVGVTMVAYAPLIIVANAELPGDNANDFAANVIKSKQPFSYGSSENLTRLIGAMYNNVYHLDGVHVPYKGGAPLMTDIASGTTMAGVTSTLTARPFIQSGRIKAIGTTGPNRSTMLPDVPTMAELGHHEWDQVFTSFSIYAPAATPRDILLKLQKAIHDATFSPEMQKALADQGAVGVANSVDDFQAQVKRDAAFWTKLANDNGLKPE